MEFGLAMGNSRDDKAVETAKCDYSDNLDLDALSAKNVEDQDASKEFFDPLLKLDRSDIQSTSDGVHAAHFLQHGSSKISTERKLEKSPTFPCSKIENVSMKLFTGSQHSPTVMPEGSSNSESQSNKNLSSTAEKAKNAACQRSLSFPSTVKVVSALKGSRGKGQPPKEKLSVKWAPDVYDPPVTSASHTVRIYQQRPRAKKDKHRKRHKTGQSNPGNSNDKNQASRSTLVSEPSRLRTQESTNDGNDAHPKGRTVRCVVTMPDYASHCQESNCVGGFLAGSFGKIQSPVAEAS